MLSAWLSLLSLLLHWAVPLASASAHARQAGEHLLAAAALQLLEGAWRHLRGRRLAGWATAATGQGGLHRGAEPAGKDCRAFAHCCRAGMHVSNQGTGPPLHTLCCVPSAARRPRKWRQVNSRALVTCPPAPDTCSDYYWLNESYWPRRGATFEVKPRRPRSQEELTCCDAPLRSLLTRHVLSQFTLPASRALPASLAASMRADPLNRQPTDQTSLLLSSNLNSPPCMSFTDVCDPEPSHSFDFCWSRVPASGGLPLFPRAHG